MSEHATDPGHRFHAMSDEQLACEAQRGHAAAFTELVRRFDKRLYNFVLRRVGGSHEAEDITQEALLRAWRNIGRYQRQWRFSTWLFTIASRLAVNHLRSAQRNRETTSAMNGSVKSVDDRARRADREHGSYIWGLAQRVCSETQVAALWLRYAEDMPVRDIARVLNKTSLAVRVQLFRARQTIAAHVATHEQERPMTSTDRSVARSMRTDAVTGGVSCTK